MGRAHSPARRAQLELGVHIADVSAFVAPGTLLDTEARSRSTTVYLPDRRFDMLPAVLSSRLCSLWSGVDRYAVSAMWELDMSTADGTPPRVLRSWFGRTLIRSRCKLHYELAQGILDAQSSDDDLCAQVRLFFGAQWAGHLSLP